MNHHLTRVLGVFATAAGHAVRLGRTGGRYVPGWSGAALVSWGAEMAWRPAGLIVAGAFLLAADALIPGNRQRGEG
ncbi:hypothetical protein P3T36_006889 [Kitasatospora sp. MAP12-15]|uniref:hypothetical protein n=1 Tax=unclassified Kitasatospora TaxID=2633591 RepID=UPI002476BC6B|nr:hypothetical protein [Kitasatospora sp. MAP12-44]MDH6111928.1 hypothetical protein [Kitasatospora sp. MAP12-44]